MRIRQRKRRTLRYIIVIMIFFAALSGGYLYSHSYDFYRESRVQRLEAETERGYVEDQLENLEINLMRKKHDAEFIGPAGEENLNRIDVRGVGPSPEPDRVFSEDDMRFTVIEH